MINYKYFIIYYKKGTGTYIVTEPRPWARENRHHFPNYNFTANHPTTETVIKHLIDNYNFKLSQFQNNKIVVIENLDPNLNL
jgi:hypothetical protein